MGLELHLDASTITSIPDGSTFATWSDISGNARHAFQGSGPSQPTYEAGELGGLPVVRFAGAQYMRSEGWSVAQPDTIFVVCRFGSLANRNPIFDSATGLSNRQVYASNATPTREMYAGETLSDGVDDGKPHLVTAKFAGASSTLRIDGKLIKLANAGGEKLTGITIGAYGALNFFLTGDIAELRIYSGGLSEAERDAIETELLLKWGFINAPPDAAVVSEPIPPDLDRLAITLSTPAGVLKRWADDEPDVEDIPIDLTLSSTVPGGDADVSCALLRDMAFRDSDLRNRNRLVVQGPGAEDVWRGYLTKTPDTKTQVSPAGVGDVGKLKGDPTLRMIPVDRDLSHWKGYSAARELLLLAGKFWGYEEASPGTDPTDGFAALVMSITAPATNPPNKVCEAFYDAGQGLTVKQIFWERKSNSTVAGSPGAIFFFQAGVADDDKLTNLEQIADTHTAEADSDPAAAWTPTTPRRWASLRWGREGEQTGSAVHKSFVRKLAVIGGEVPTTNDPKTGVPGVLGPDVLKAILNKAGGGIGYDSDSIEGSQFVIPHLAWLEAITAEQGILDVNRFFRNLWGVYAGKLRWASPETFGDLWHVRRDEGADPQFNGPDSDQEYNGVIVKYDDALTGARGVVGPPASQLKGPSGLSTATLLDSDPYLPLNEWGERKWAVVEAGLTSEAGAIRLGELFLQGLQARVTSGSIEIQAWQVYDATGARYPAWAPKAGDRLLVDDEPNAAERLIVEASYKHAGRTASLTLDSPPDALEALQERLQVVLVGVVD